MPIDGNRSRARQKDLHLIWMHVGDLDACANEVSKGPQGTAVLFLLFSQRLAVCNVLLNE